MNEQNSALQQIIAEIEHLPENQSYTKRGIPPIFQFHKEAKILLVGQAPGRKVEESGIPFHDLSGKRLMEWMGISEEIFYGSLPLFPWTFIIPERERAETFHPGALCVNITMKLWRCSPRLSFGF